MLNLKLFVTMLINVPLNALYKGALTF